MRAARAFAALALLAACQEATTEPFRPVSGPVPSELPASFRLLSAADSLLRGHPSVTAAGDSVTVVATGTAGGCSFRSARAGVRDGVLVVTRFDSIPPGGLYCLFSTPGPATFKIVVRPVASGRIAVTVRERLQAQAGASAYQERELARRTVTVR